MTSDAEKRLRALESEVLRLRAYIGRLETLLRAAVQQLYRLGGRASS